MLRLTKSQHILTHPAAHSQKIPSTHLRQSGGRLDSRPQDRQALQRAASKGNWACTAGSTSAAMKADQSGAPKFINITIPTNKFTQGTTFSSQGI